MIIATCGCKIPEARYDILHEWDSETRDCKPCVNFGSLCENCEKLYKKENILRRVTKPVNGGEVILWERKNE